MSSNLGPIAGPSLPPHLKKKTINDNNTREDSDSDSEDEFMPALPPQLKQSRPTIGPSLPPSNFKKDSQNQEEEKEEEEDSYDDYGTGPLPLPESLKKSYDDESEGVRMLREREERQRERERIEAEGKLLKRDEWMLLPPKDITLAGSIDPTKIKARGFKQTSKPHASESSERNQEPGSLWTETPAERQERLKDEATGKRKRAENNSKRNDDDDDLDEIKRSKRNQLMKNQVEKHNKSTRNESLLELHKKAKKNVQDSKSKAERSLEKKNEVIWDHDSMIRSNGGKLIEDRQRDQVFKDAKGLGGRFGKGSFI